jgi:hypothetical protein
MDRGYLDFERLYTFAQTGAFFLTQEKTNMDARRLYSAPTDRSTGLICDQTIVHSIRAVGRSSYASSGSRGVFQHNRPSIVVPQTQKTPLMRGSFISSSRGRRNQRAINSDLFSFDRAGNGIHVDALPEVVQIRI